MKTSILFAMPTDDCHVISYFVYVFLSYAKKIFKQ